MIRFCRPDSACSRIQIYPIQTDLRIVFHGKVLRLGGNAGRFLDKRPTVIEEDPRRPYLDSQPGECRESGSRTPCSLLAASIRSSDSQRGTVRLWRRIDPEERFFGPLVWHGRWNILRSRVIRITAPGVLQIRRELRRKMQSTGACNMGPLLHSRISFRIVRGVDPAEREAQRGDPAVFLKLDRDLVPIKMTISIGVIVIHLSMDEKDAWPERGERLGRNPRYPLTVPESPRHPRVS